MSPARDSGSPGAPATLALGAALTLAGLAFGLAAALVAGITLLALGLTLVIAPNVVGISNVYGLPLGLLALASGLGWLVLRLWPAPPDDRDEDDDGAQI